MDSWGKLIIKILIIAPIAFLLFLGAVYLIKKSSGPDYALFHAAATPYVEDTLKLMSERWDYYDMKPRLAKQEYSPDMEKTILDIFKGYSRLGKLKTYEEPQLVLFKTQSGTSPLGVGIYEVKAKYENGNVKVRFQIQMQNQILSVQKLDIENDYTSYLAPNNAPVWDTRLPQN